MEPRRSGRQRCTECREWYEPAPSALASQKVCGKTCRTARNGTLARRRREEHLHEYRVAERERQRTCREAQRAEYTRGASRVTDPLVTPRHAPASAPSRLESFGKLLAEWDRQAARSRATLERAMDVILQESSAMDGTTPSVPEPVSRATLPS